MLVSQGIAPMENEDWFQQLPLFVAVSLGGGLLGAIFNAAHKAMFKARRPHMLITSLQEIDRHSLRPCLNRLCPRSTWQLAQSFTHCASTLAGGLESVCKAWAPAAMYMHTASCLGVPSIFCWGRLHV